MAMTQDQINAYNNDLQTQINNNQLSLGVTNGSMDTVTSQIQTLQSAIRNAQSQITSYQSFAGKVRGDFESTSSSNFKGSLQSKLSKEFENKSNAVKAEVKSHNQNIQVMQAKLKDLQNYQNSLSGQISGLTSLIADLAGQFL